MANSVRISGSDAAEIGLALYQTLRTNGSSSPSDAAADLGLTDGEAAVGWAELRALGLIRPNPASQEIDSVEPDTALIGLLARQRDALQAQRDELASIVSAAESLIERYRPAVLRESADIEVEIARGDNRKRRMLRDFNARISLSTGSMHPGPLPPAEILKQSLNIDSELISRGIKIRAIYGQSIDSAPRQRKYLSELTEVGVEVRLAPQVPFDLIIADSHSALLSANPEEPSYALIVVRGSALVRSYTALYEDCWLRAVPHAAKSTGAADGTSELTEQHRTTLRLLANGLTDERIARKLGVSLRTVSRLVSEIMKHLGADSRFQAGVLAGARDLI